MPDTADSRRVTIFKPIPDRRGALPSAHTVRAIGSFVAQLGPRDELLLAMSEQDEAAWEDILRTWREQIHDTEEVATGFYTKKEGASGTIQIIGNSSLLEFNELKSFYIRQVQGGSTDWKIDLARCTHLDSAFLGDLAGMGMKIRETSRVLTVINATEAHRKLLNQFGLDRLFQISNVNDGQSTPFSHGNRLRILRREASALANPKAACLQQMAPHARGEFWLWSDADVIAPQGIVEYALNCIDARASEAPIASDGPDLRPSPHPRAITIPYSVAGTHSAPGILDVLYVNAELLPGLRFIAATSGRAAFALGAFTLFYARDFREKADWQRIGGSLADDFELGQALQPVAVCGAHRVEIAAEEPDWASAILHYYRWQKNIRWCQPVGFAAQIFITPVAVSLLVLAVLVGLKTGFWLGLGADVALAQAALHTLVLIVLESAWALILCRAVSCRLGWRGALAPVWSVIRAATWLAVWLPIPVRWGKTWWRGPRTLV